MILKVYEVMIKEALTYSSADTKSGHEGDAGVG